METDSIHARRSSLTELHPPRMRYASPSRLRTLAWSGLNSPLNHRIKLSAGAMCNILEFLLRSVARTTAQYSFIAFLTSASAAADTRSIFSVIAEGLPSMFAATLDSAGLNCVL
jgi:xanthine/uracil permease